MRDALATEYAELYPKLVGQLADLFSRAEARKPRRGVTLAVKLREFYLEFTEQFVPLL